MFEPLPIHPLAELFPMGSDQELKDLAGDIKVNGFWGAIITHEGQVLDGRRRQAACTIAGVAPVYKEWGGECESPTAFVISANLHRRHLSVAERALLAVEAKKWLRKEAEERQKASQAKPGQKIGAGKNGEAKKTDSPPAQGGRTDARALGGKASEHAAKLAGVSARTVEHAEKVVNKGAPELKKAMQEGTVPVARAAKIADLPLDQQVAAMEKDESAPRRTGVDEDKRIDQELRSVRKWLNQHMDLSRNKAQAHARVDEVWDEVAAERKEKQKKVAAD